MANRRTKIRFPVYNKYTITVIHSKNLLRTGKAVGVDLTNCGACFVEHPTRSLRSWLLFEVGNVNEMIIAHEASHAIRSMFRKVGVRCDDETYAYHLGHLVERLHKFLRV